MVVVVVVVVVVVLVVVVVVVLVVVVPHVALQAAPLEVGQLLVCHAHPPDPVLQYDPPLEGGFGQQVRPGAKQPPEAQLLLTWFQPVLGPTVQYSHELDPVHGQIVVVVVLVVEVEVVVVVVVVVGGGPHCV